MLKLCLCVTRTVKDNGLGFDYKWDMGWMNDTLAYFRTNPTDRTREYHKLTFSMMYFSNENFMMPFSHDEVVHGKATIVQKMNGDYEDKFPQARALYLYMYAHPVKKLNFMGNEIGQLRALYALDYSQKGFEWIDCHQEEKCIYVFERRGKKQRLITILNFSDKKQSYKLKIASGKCLSLLISTDNEIYGGKENYEHMSKVLLENGCTDLEINAFTGMLFELC